MSTLEGPFYPTDELVATAWLTQRVPGLTAGQVATTLPKTVDSWVDEGFVQVTVMSAGRDLIDIPVRRPIVDIDCWAAPPASSSKVPWHKAARLVELIRVAMDDDTSFGQPVTMPANYLGARVQAVYLAINPNRVTGDTSGFARFNMSLEVDWVRQ